MQSSVRFLRQQWQLQHTGFGTRKESERTHQRCQECHCGCWRKRRGRKISGYQPARHSDPAAGYHAAILDADITGPSIPKIFGINKPAEAVDNSLLPHVTESGVKIMSMNMLLPNATDPVLWRGPVISGVVKQFWEDVQWGDVDFLFVDMPPGTGDVPLTVFQSLPINGILIVSTPQSLVSMIVDKAMNMAQMMQVPVLGMVENMRFLRCPDCGKEIPLFGSDDHVDNHTVPVLERIPLDPTVAAACDAGKLEQAEIDYLAKTAVMLTETFGKKQ